MKKLFVILASVALLTSCGISNSTTTVSSSTPSPSVSTQVSSSVVSSTPNPISTPVTPSTTVTPSSTIAPSTPKPIDPESVILDFTFAGYDQDDTIFDFFSQNWSTAGSKFGTNYLKLLRGGDEAGFVRTPVLPEHSNSLDVTLYTHITGLQNIDSSAIGKYIDFRVEGIKLVDEENATYEIVDKVQYLHTITAEDVANHSFPDFPAYSSDFSSDPYTVTLKGEGIEKVRVVMYNKIIYGSNQDGCNVDIHRMIISDNNK